MRVLLFVIKWRMLKDPVQHAIVYAPYQHMEMGNGPHALKNRRVLEPQHLVLPLHPQRHVERPADKLPGNPRAALGQLASLVRLERDLQPHANVPDPRFDAVRPVVQQDAVVRPLGEGRVAFGREDGAPGRGGGGCWFPVQTLLEEEVCAAAVVLADLGRPCLVLAQLGGQPGEFGEGALCCGVLEPWGNHILGGYTNDAFYEFPA
jgi:hypothetical protein